MSKLNTALNLLRGNPLELILALERNNLLNWLPDKTYLRLLYYGATGKKLNLDNPRTFNEKIQWLKINDRQPEYVQYVDKYAVYEHIRSTIGDEYLVPLIGVYSDPSDIKWDTLPNQFVLKCTHGSGFNIICMDKEKLDIGFCCRQLTTWLKNNYFWHGREWPYKTLVPRIICQEFLSDNGIIPIDYKVLCFNGKARLIEVHMDRFGINPTQDFYDTLWNKTGICQGHSISNKVVDKPECLYEMLNLSEILARGIAHVRIDWYEVGGKLYFGEMTFYDASGFDTFSNPEHDLMLGSWIDLKGV